MNSKQKGDISVSRVIAALLEQGHSVSLPFGDNDRYDLIWDDRIDLKRVQVKTGRLRDGVVKAKLYSVQTHKKGVPFTEASQTYQDDVEVFGIYCPDTNKTYMIPIEEAPGQELNLRVEPTKNNQQKKILWAKDYEIGV